MIAHSPESWTADLIAAGWREVRLNVWADIDCRLWRGPYGAWCVLQRVLAGEVPRHPMDDVVEAAPPTGGTS